MKNFTFPALAAMVVASLATLLLSIGARSPYTHANLAPQFDARYARTEQALLGPPVPFRGPGLASSQSAPGGAQLRGQVLMVSHGCASCHGLEGRGGVVGPSIIGSGIADLLAKTEKGPSAMPAYGSGKLLPDDLEAIAAFLAAPPAPRLPAALTPQPAATVLPARLDAPSPAPSSARAAPPTTVPSPGATVAPSPVAPPTAVPSPRATDSPPATPSRAAIEPPTPAPSATVAAPAAPKSPVATPTASTGAASSLTCAPGTAPDVCRIRVTITDNGFNGLAEGLAIEARQGQQVELTFAFAETKFAKDAHVIGLSGYELKTEEIDARHREATLKFVADKPGRFTFQCDTECDIHRKLREAILVIR